MVSPLSHHFFIPFSITDNHPAFLSPHGSVLRSHLLEKAGNWGFAEEMMRNSRLLMN